MVHTALRSLIVGAYLLVSATAAGADERIGSVYLAGGIAAPYQSGPSGNASQIYVKAPGGVTRGWFLGGGVRITRNLSVDTELSTTGWMTARQPSRYGMTFNEDRRDRFALFAARFHLRRERMIGVEPVAGMAWTRSEGWSQTDYYNLFEPSQPPVAGRRHRHSPATTIGPLFGCDLRIGNGPIAVVPSFRAFMSDTANGYEPYPGGYPSWTFRSGLGVRVRLGSR